MKSPSKQWTLRRLGIIPVFFLSLFPGCYAQLYNTDAASIALAGCYSIGAGGQAGIYNEAILGYESSTIFQVSHVRPFVIKELGVSSVSMQFPLFPGNMHIELQQYGIPGYQQVNSSLGYGLKLSEIILAGVGFRYYNTISQGELSYLRAIGFSGGVVVKVSKSTLLAAHIINPVTISNYPAYGSIFPSIITFGLRKEIYASSFLLSEISYHSASGLQIHIAADYQCVDKLVLRAGYRSNPMWLSFGTEIVFAPVSVAFAMAYSTRCGVIPALTVTYPAGK